MTGERAAWWLKRLALFHYLMAFAAGFLACSPMLYFGLGLLVGADVSAEFSSSTRIVAVAAIFLVGWIYAVGMVIAGRSLMQRNRYSFCLAMAWVSCINFPVGTVLAVFTLYVLAQPVVREMYGLD